MKEPEGEAKTLMVRHVRPGQLKRKVEGLDGAEPWNVVVDMGS